jgi:hypothetical protein
MIKKHFLLIVVLVLFGCMNSFSQQENRFAHPKYQTGRKVRTSEPNLRKAALAPTIQTTIFQDDFAGSLDTTKWFIVDNMGFGEIWTHTTTGPNSGPGSIPIPLNPVGTTAANGYMIFDSDNGINAAAPEDCDLITAPINCTGHNTVFLTFNQFFLQYLTSTGLVSVSNDGITWNDIYSIDNGFDEDSATANPDFQVHDITAFAANQPAVYIRFRFTGNYDWYWELDDILVYEPATNDVGVTAISGLQSGCNLSSAATVSITVNNFGTASISNIPVIVTMNGAAVLTETIPGPLALGASLNYTFTGTLNLSAAGNYNIRVSTSLNGDVNTQNDSVGISITNAAPFVVTSPYTMGFETNENVSGWKFTDGNGDGITWTVANSGGYNSTRCLRKTATTNSSFDNDWAWTDCLFLQAGTSYALDYFYRNISSQYPCSLKVMVSTTQDIATSTQLIVSENIDTLWHRSINTFQVPTSGTYHVAFHAYVPNTSPFQPSGTLRIDNINILIATALNEIGTNKIVSLYPNPSSGMVTVSARLNGQSSLRIFNMLGQDVHSQPLTGDQTTIDLSSFAKGVYHFLVTSSEGTFSEKVIVR